METHEPFSPALESKQSFGLSDAGTASDSLGRWIEHSLQHPGKKLEIPKALAFSKTVFGNRTCSIHVQGDSVQIVTEEREIKAKRPLISVVIPIYFEEEIIDELVKRLEGAARSLYNYDYELIFVNDGSTDRSFELLKVHYERDPTHIRIINLSRNFGHQMAISAGFSFSRGDAVVAIDGDLQDPPEVIPQMVAEWEQGYHVVYGVRQQRQGESAFKLITAKVFYRILSRLSELDLPVDAGDFRLMDRKVVEQLNRLPEKSRYIRGLVNWVGFKQKGLPYERDKRFAGETKYTLKKMIRFAIDGITSFSEKPLNIAAYLGIAFSLLALLGIFWVFGSYILGREHLVTGWASTMTAIFTIGAIQLLALSVVGQYVGRIYKETRDRPLFIVQETLGAATKNDALF